MSRALGLCLMEVLIALFIVTTLSLGLLRHHWVIIKKTRQLTLKTHAMIHLNNIIERRRSHLTHYVFNDKLYDLSIQHSANKHFKVKISWPCEPMLGCFANFITRDVIG